MVALGLAVVGKNHELLYHQTFSGTAGEDLADTDEEESTRLTFAMHAALDRLDQLSGPPPGKAWRKLASSQGRSPFFAGLLCPMDEMKLYGYVTSTQVKFILILEDEARPMEDEVQSLFQQIHNLYVAHLMNPFKALETSAMSPGFDQGVHYYITAFNQAERII
eukprot:Nitzschia sp. Nitz4//scaffold2_size372955//158279//158885//NITZ4_000412-RA/size372955-snap-gene-0.78-mRNA-1//-1//CDS//3329546745//3426//frame0